jgi:hypothetical protein
LVDATLFIVTASVLSVFNVTKAKDENGHEIPVSPAMQSDAISRCVALAAAISTSYQVVPYSQPVKFECSITPRDKVAEDLIKNECSGVMLYPLALGSLCTYECPA